MRVAIVEDEKETAEDIMSMFETYAKTYKTAVECEYFSTAISFLEKYRFCYDIVFMDINLTDMDGMKAAAKLRERDGDVLIVFATNMAQYAVKGYMVGAFDFIVKPVVYNHLCQVVNRARKSLDLRRNTPKVYVSRAGETIALNAQEISYIEIISHTLHYHIGEEELTATGKLSSLEQTLSKYGFFRCNNGYLVNLRFVEAVEGYTVKVGGASLPISRPKRKSFIAALTQFMNGE